MLDELDNFTFCIVRFKVKPYDEPVWPLFSSKWTLLGKIKHIIKQHELTIDGWDLYKTVENQRYYVGTIETEDEYHRRRSGKH